MQVYVSSLHEIRVVKQFTSNVFVQSSLIEVISSWFWFVRCINLQRLVVGFILYFIPEQHNKWLGIILLDCILLASGGDRWNTLKKIKFFVACHKSTRPCLTAISNNEWYT